MYSKDKTKGKNTADKDHTSIRAEHKRQYNTLKLCLYIDTVQQSEHYVEKIENTINHNKKAVGPTIPEACIHACVLCLLMLFNRADFSLIFMCKV